MSYTSFAKRQRKWFTEIRKNAKHTGKRENIENPLEQCRRQNIAGLKILMIVSTEQGKQQETATFWDSAMSNLADH